MANSSGSATSKPNFEASFTALQNHSLLNTLRLSLVSLVADADQPDLTDRQKAVFLVSYLTDGPHTVRGLAAILNVSKPAITRALDRLSEMDLVRRKTDPLDRRSILVQRTNVGLKYLQRLAETMEEAQIQAKPKPVRKAA